MLRFSLLDAICGVVLSQRSGPMDNVSPRQCQATIRNPAAFVLNQRNCIMTASLRPHKNGNVKRLPAGDVSSGKLWIVFRRAYHSVVGFLESGITARGVALSDFVVLEVLLHKGDLTAAEIAKKTRLAAASVEITIANLKEQELVGFRSREGRQQDKPHFKLTKRGHELIAWLYEEHEKDIAILFDVLPNDQ